MVCSWNWRIGPTWAALSIQRRSRSDIATSPSAAFLSSMNSCLPAGGMWKVDLSPVTRFSYTLHGRGDVEGAGIKALGTIILLSIILSGL